MSLWQAVKKALWVLFCLWLLFQFVVFYRLAPDSKGRMAVIMCLVWALVLAAFTHFKRKRRRN